MVCVLCRLKGEVWCVFYVECGVRYGMCFMQTEG